MNTEILHAIVKIESRLLQGSVVARILDLRRLGTEGVGIFLARRISPGPMTVAATRSLGQADYKVVGVASIMSSIPKESSGNCHHTVINLGQH